MHTCFKNLTFDLLFNALLFRFRKYGQQEQAGVELEGVWVSNEKKAIEEDESDVTRKDKKSEGEDKNLKVAFCNEEKSDSYNGLAKVDDADEGSEVIITENINDDTSLDYYKGPLTLEVGKTGC